MLGVKPFIDAMDNVANEAYRVLKKGKMCAVMIGDIRKCGKVVPYDGVFFACWIYQQRNNYKRTA